MPGRGWRRVPVCPSLTPARGAPAPTSQPSAEPPSDLHRAAVVLASQRPKAGTSSASCPMPRSECRSAALLVKKAVARMAQSR